MIRIIVKINFKSKFVTLIDKTIFNRLTPMFNRPTFELVKLRVKNNRTLLG